VDAVRSELDVEDPVPTQHRLRRRVHGLARVLRERGAVAVVRDLWSDNFRRFRFFSGEIPDVGAHAAEERWRLVGPDEAEAWVLENPRTSESNPRVHEVALENQHLLFLAEHEGRVVGHRWVARGWMYVVSGSDQFMLRFPADMGFFYDLFVHKDYRRRGIGGGSSHRPFKILPRLGLTRCATSMVERNRTGRRCWMALGIPWWDTARLVIGSRTLWFPRKPWARLGVAELVRIRS